MLLFAEEAAAAVAVVAAAVIVVAVVNSLVHARVVYSTCTSRRLLHRHTNIWRIRSFYQIKVQNYS